MFMNNNWAHYKNGNYTVHINLNNGTKIRENDLDSLIPSRPESIDCKITNQCDMGCPYCFPENTSITTTKGLIPISLLKVGDEVLSYNIKSRKRELKNVKTVYNRVYEGDLIKIHLDNGTYIECTPNHKIYTQRGYVRADSLSESDEILTINET